MACAWSVAGEDTALTQTLLVTGEYISRVSSTAATQLKVPSVVVGIGHSFGDLATGTSVTAMGFWGMVGSAEATTLALDVFPDGEPLTHHV